MTYDRKAQSRAIAAGASGVLEMTHRNSGAVKVTEVVVEVTTDGVGVEPVRLKLSLLPRGEIGCRHEASQPGAARAA
ncbi:MAG: hypothetical protein AAF333_02510 [Planctomycetota bacterium]